MKLKYQFAIHQIADFWAAVPVGRDAANYHNVISLNVSACDMMRFLQQDITFDQLVELMQKEYEDVDADTLRSDAEAFVQQLRNANVLVE